MICVSGLDQARNALRAGEHALISPPYAACHAGVNYWRAVLQQLRLEFPDTAFAFTLCCGDDPAIAHDALRLGLIRIICDCGEGQFAQLTSIAAALHGQVQRHYPQAG